MKYTGSKRRIIKYIKPIIDSYRSDGQTYVEPFVGGCNSFVHFEGPSIGGDFNPYLIAFLNALRDGWEPPKDVSQELYQSIRYDYGSYPPELVGCVALCASYYGLWFRAYAHKGKVEKCGRVRDYYAEAVRSAKRTVSKLKGGSVLVHSGYSELDIPEGSLIYCDPPYGSHDKPYIGNKKFDSPAFHKWCRKMASQGHTVLVSGRDAPNDFRMLWESEAPKTHVSQKKAYKERLYIVPA